VTVGSISEATDPCGARATEVEVARGVEVERASDAGGFEAGASPGAPHATSTEAIRTTNQPLIRKRYAAKDTVSSSIR
jgi:hypothetical protein